MVLLQSASRVGTGSTDYLLFTPSFSCVTSLLDFFR